MRRSSSVTSFDSFLTARERASTAFVEGDAGPLLAVVGADAVNSSNTAGAESFVPGAENRFEILHSGSDGDLGYWTGVQRSTVLLKDKQEPVTMNLRITELFRRVDGEWKLFHRHADLLQEL
jgi:ketosteroid isomerase-like protein